MKNSRFLVATSLLLLWLTPLAAHADDLTPIVQPTSPVVSQPTAAPVVADTSVPIAVPTPVTESTPVSVTKEQTNPVVRIDQPGSPVSTPVIRSTDVVSAGQHGLQGASQGYTQSPTTRVPAKSASVPQLQYNTPPSSQVSAPGTAANPDSGVTSSVYQPGSASAPSQLKCTGKKHSAASPFFIAPFAGWSEIVSFVDHDSPDYAIDGKIVIANGLTANASDGQASDLFPSYWSPVLRQYLNYDGHNGYDFDISYQPVLAAAAGTVQFAGWNSSNEYAGYGQMILLRHRDGYVTLYGHLSKLEVQAGDKVRAGQEIGISGTTGHSSGPHLHFSVFHDCNVTDPYGWTGHGPDPLYAFDGENAQYLWLPGHDPLILNPPPGWPTFPVGLHIYLPHSRVKAGAHAAPSIDRLLLLALPTPQHGKPVSAGIALARTEASIGQEADALTPQLDDLKALGLIQAYQVIPAAGAIWVRGTASAAALEGLPGVASLTGIRPHDLNAAQSGLAHSVLIQIGHQQAPSLWPAGFHSVLQPWRLTMSVLRGHALVAGFTLPGQRVVISLRRAGGAIGAAETISDPQTGGFVAMVHGANGEPVSLSEGDTIEAASGGKISVVRISRFTLQARSFSVKGQTDALSTVSVVSLGRFRDSSWKALVYASTNGQFSAPVRRRMGAGSMIIASVVDTAGNQESATASVPGLVITEGSSRVSGWTVGVNPILKLNRGGKTIYIDRLQPAPDGRFEIELKSAGHELVARAGDTISIGSRWHHRIITLPRLSATLGADSSRIVLMAPAHANVELRLIRPSGSPQSDFVVMGASGLRTLNLGSPLRLGDSARIQIMTSGGDYIMTTSLARGVVIRTGSPSVSGNAEPGSDVLVRVRSRTGTDLGGAFVSASASAGHFSARVRSSAGHTVRIETGMHVVIQDRSASASVAVPSLALKVDAHARTIHADWNGTHAVVLDVMTAGGRRSSQRFSAATSHDTLLHLSPTDAATLSQVRLRADIGRGIDVERVVTFAAHPHVASAHAHVAINSACQKAGPASRGSKCRAQKRAKS